MWAIALDQPQGNEIFDDRNLSLANIDEQKDVAIHGEKSFGSMEEAPKNPSVRIKKSRSKS